MWSHWAADNIEPAITSANFTVPWSCRQLGVENANGNAELFEVELRLIAAIDVVDEDDGLAADQLELEQRVDQNELVLFLQPIKKADSKI